MIQFFITVAALIAGFVAAVDLIRYWQNHEDKEAIRIVGNTVAVILALSFVVNFAYLAPKSAGDKFVDAWRVTDSALLLSSICEDTELYEGMSQGALILNFGRFLGVSAIIDSTIFIPIFNRMEVKYRMAGITGTEEQTKMTLKIRPKSLTSYCVYELESDEE